MLTDNIKIRTYEWGRSPEFSGEGCWEFRVEDIAPFLELDYVEVGGMREHNTRLADYLRDECDWDCEDSDEDVVSVSHADLAIGLLALLCSTGGGSVSWSGPDAFWAWHDLGHVEKGHGWADVSYGSFGVSGVDSGADEDAAHVTGGMIAIERGELRLSDCVRTLAEVAQEHDERFGVGSGALVELVEWFENRGGLAQV